MFGKKSKYVSLIMWTNTAPVRAFLRDDAGTPHVRIELQPNVPYAATADDLETLKRQVASGKLLVIPLDELDKHRVPTAVHTEPKPQGPIEGVGGKIISLPPEWGKRSVGPMPEPEKHVHPIYGG